jgi:hypothetical protein
MRIIQRNNSTRPNGRLGQLQMDAGNVDVPAISWLQNPTTGWSLSPSNNAVQTIVNGVRTFEWNDTSTQSIVPLSANVFAISNGTITWSGSTLDDLRIRNGTNLIAQFSSSQVQVVPRILANSSATLSSPAYSFASSTSSGMLNTSSGVVIANAGVQVASFETGLCRVDRVETIAGTISAPAIRLQGSSNGFAFVGDAIHTIIGGVSQFAVTSSGASIPSFTTDIFTLNNAGITILTVKTFSNEGNVTFQIRDNVDVSPIVRNVMTLVPVPLSVRAPNTSNALIAISPDSGLAFTSTSGNVSSVRQYITTASDFIIRDDASNGSVVFFNQSTGNAGVVMMTGNGNTAATIIPWSIVKSGAYDPTASTSIYAQLGTDVSRFAGRVVTANNTSEPFGTSSVLQW